MKKMIQRAKFGMLKTVISTRRVLTDKSGNSALDIGLTILIAVVLAALLLAGLYALFGNTILPTITSKIKDMFNYQG